MGKDFPPNEDISTSWKGWMLFFWGLLHLNHVYTTIWTQYYDMIPIASHCICTRCCSIFLGFIFIISIYSYCNASLSKNACSCIRPRQISSQSRRRHVRIVRALSKSSSRSKGYSMAGPHNQDHHHHKHTCKLHTKLTKPFRTFFWYFQHLNLVSDARFTLPFLPWL